MKELAKWAEEKVRQEREVEKLIALIEQSYYCDIVSLAEDLVSKGVTVQEWILVKDRLPEYDQVVLCYKDDRGVRIGKHMSATYADGVVAFKDLVRDYAFGATHWMPLPQPPKGE